MANELKMIAPVQKLALPEMTQYDKDVAAALEKLVLPSLKEEELSFFINLCYHRIFVLEHGKFVAAIPASFGPVQHQTPTSNLAITDQNGHQISQSKWESGTNERGYFEITSVEKPLPFRRIRHGSVKMRLDGTNYEIHGGFQINSTTGKEEGYIHRTEDGGIQWGPTEGCIAPSDSDAVLLLNLLRSHGYVKDWQVLKRAKVQVVYEPFDIDEKGRWLYIFGDEYGKVSDEELTQKILARLGGTEAEIDGKMKEIEAERERVASDINALEEGKGKELAQARATLSEKEEDFRKGRRQIPPETVRKTFERTHAEDIKIVQGLEKEVTAERKGLQSELEEAETELANLSQVRQKTSGYIQKIKEGRQVILSNEAYRAAL